MKWRLHAAIYFYRQYEQYFIDRGFNIALGGSVIKSGASEKDLDIWVIPIPRVNLMAAEPACLEKVWELKDWLKNDGLPGFEFIEDGHWNALCRKWKLRNADGFVVELFVVQDDRD